MKSIAILIGAALGSWALALGPACWFWGFPAFVQSGLALLLCLVPAVLTMGAALKWGKESPETFMLLALGGTGVRMMLVLGVVSVLVMGFPGEYPPEFVYWVTFFYLALLGVEIALLLRQNNAASKS